MSDTPKRQNLDERLELRLSRADRLLFAAAAKRAGVSLAAWIRSVCRAAIRDGRKGP